MKNLFLLLLFPAFFAGAQHYAWQTEFNAQVNDMHLLPNGHWLIGGTVTDAGGIFDWAYLVEATPDGAYFSSDLTTTSDRTIITAMVPLPDKRLLLGGRSGICDAFFGGFIQLRDSSMGVVWTRKWDNNPLPSSFVPEVSAMLLTPETEILVVGNDKIWRLELETGQLLEEKKIIGARIYDLAYTYDGKGYLLASKNAILGMDSALNTEVLHTIPEAGKSYIRVIAARNGGFFALRDDGKIQYRRWIDVGYAWMLIDPGFQVTDMTAHPSGLAFCGMKGGKGHAGTITDTLDQVETSGFALEYPEIVPQKIGVDPPNGALVLAGVELHGPPPRTINNETGSHHLWIQSFAPDGTTQNAACDAALVELVVHGLPQVYPYNGGPPWSPFKWKMSKSGEFSVRLKNNGADTLQSVHILAGRYSFSDPGYCPWADYINKRFEQLDLAPGADTLLYLGFLGWGYAKTVMPWDICIWTTAPNDQIDINHDNDYVCGEFNLVSATYEQKTAAVELFPNPAYDALYLQTNGEAPGLCRIFNAAGRLVAEQMPVSGPEACRLDVSRLPAGFYWLQTERGQGRFVKM